MAKYVVQRPDIDDYPNSWHLWTWVLLDKNDDELVRGFHFESQKAAHDNIKQVKKVGGMRCIVEFDGTDK